MFNFLKKETRGTGLLPDTRTAEEKAKDFSSGELFFGGVEWKNRVNEIQSFPIFDQDGSGSCVAQATTKALGINNFLDEGFFVHLSARDFYTRRYNQSSAGMNFYDAATIARDYGATLEQLMPSQKLDEVKMNIISDRTKTSDFIARMFKAKNFIFVPLHIENIAQVIAQNKPVLLGFRFTYEEWNRDMPVILGNEAPLGHGVCGIPNGHTIYNGKKCIAIEDSWGTGYGINGRRYISEDFIEKRAVTAIYFEDLNNLHQTGTQTQKHKFTKELGLGMQDDEVKRLQEVLATIKDNEGYLFPLTQQGATGYFGGITRQAVKRFQTLKGIVPVSGYVGPKTIDELNKLN